MTADPVLDAARRSAQPRQAAAAGDFPVALRRLPLRSVLNLRGRLDAEGRFAEAVQQATGLSLPPANRWQAAGERRALWLGPDEWLIVAPTGEAEILEAALRRMRPEDPWLAVTDISHNSTVFALSGSKARSVLATGCPIDLHPRAFAAGSCVQTILARTRTLLCLTDPEAPEIEIWVRNSFARYTADWLHDAMAEYLETPRQASHRRMERGERP